MEPTPTPPDPAKSPVHDQGTQPPASEAEPTLRHLPELSATPAPIDWLRMDPTTLHRSAKAPGGAPLPPRVTVIEQVYYQPPSDKPTTVVGSFGYDPRSSEEPDTWKFTADAQWKPLGPCRVSEPAFILLHNRSETRSVQLGVVRQADADEAAKTMFDPPPRGAEEPVALAPLLPGRTMRLPVDYRLTAIRGVDGPVPCTISVFPS